MSKRNTVAFVKPPDPKFLQEMKKAAGYVEGPTIHDKRPKFDDGFDSGDSDPDYEDADAPEVVVLKKGDLTAEEAKLEQQRIEKEENEKPADLSQRVIFKSNRGKVDKEASSTDSKTESQEKNRDKKGAAQAKSALSFADEDDVEEEEEEDEC